MPKKMELWILNHSCCIIILKQRKLQSNPTLKGISHVVVDEVHERDINTDLLLALLRTSLNENPDLRVVLMSATGDNHRLAQYFGCCPIVKVPGFVHPVRDKYLEDVLKEMGRRSQVPERAKTDKENDATPDLDLVADVIEHIDRCGEPAACLTRDPFHNSLQNRALVNKAKEALSGSSYSDYLVVSRAVLGWRKVQQEGTAVLVLESIVKSLNLSGTL